MHPCLSLHIYDQGQENKHT